MVGGGPVPQNTAIPEVLTYIFTPEWNEQDIADPKSKLLLVLLKHRSTTTLTQQFLKGANGSLGDRDFVKGLPLHRDAQTGFFILFQNDHTYGDKHRSVDYLNVITDPFSQSILCVSEPFGELIFLRQMSVMKLLHLFIFTALSDMGSSYIPSIWGKLRERPTENPNMASCDLNCYKKQQNTPSQTLSSHRSIEQPNQTSVLPGTKTGTKELCKESSASISHKLSSDPVRDPPKKNLGNDNVEPEIPSADHLEPSSGCIPKKSQPGPGKNTPVLPPEAVINSRIPKLVDFFTGAVHQEFEASNYRERLKTDEMMLCDWVLNWCSTAPEGLADKDGHVLLSRAKRSTETHLGICLFEAIHFIDRNIMTWNTIRTILYVLAQLDQGKKVAKKRSRLLQELANVCYRHYYDLQNFFRRNIQCGIARKYRRRLADTYDGFGTPVVMLKNHPRDFVKSNPLMHYFLRLSQPEINPIEALDCAEKIPKYKEVYAHKIPRMTDGESSSLYNLTLVSGFLRDLHHYVRMPPACAIEGREFISKTDDLYVSFDKLKWQLSAPKYTEYLCNMAKDPSRNRGVNPNLHCKALEAMDELVETRMGSVTTELYRNAIRDCFGEAADFDLSEIKVTVEAAISAPAVVPTSAPGVANEQPNQPTKKKRTKKKKKNTSASPTSQDDPNDKEESGKEDEAPMPSIDEIWEDLMSVMNDDDSEHLSQERSVSSLSDDNTGLVMEDDAAHTQPIEDQNPASEGSITDQAGKETHVTANDEAHNAEDRGWNLDDHDIDEAASDEETGAEAAEAAIPDVNLDHDDANPPKEVLKVSARTAGVFAMLFDKRIHRGSITWTRFVAAFAEIGFSVEKKKRSAIASIPPSGTPWNQIQFHEVHGRLTRVEGYRSRKMANRLTRAYGWDETTFVVG
ncbi:uncharacterized protein ColSpa_07918 [Colletotrichum spaethianum]|uniref:Uncharacterized protein n=1 Tax=Colletotrichum spaethianum TaxID=700344 RepID=A0AA37P8S6_9PEZI|nr:uncharacterized protein ColSpa_07918 [Colletotrichum spaethianum]GKT47737.1 hypothetical protein ColSpa_07918 [Colletotrichum spaethianum]